jgi:hypothetical protein
MKFASLCLLLALISPVASLRGKGLRRTQDVRPSGETSEGVEETTEKEADTAKELPEEEEEKVEELPEVSDANLEMTNDTDAGLDAGMDQAKKKDSDKSKKEKKYSGGGVRLFYPVCSVFSVRSSVRCLSHVS